MTKHIIYMSLFQMIVLFIFLFDGEFLIPEPNVELRYNDFRWALGYDIDTENTYVFPGRLYKLNGDDLYEAYIESDEINGHASRHMTFIFNLFIWLQIINMIASRKINDELNICNGFWSNPAFLIIWVVIVGVNFLIIQYTGEFFSLHPEGQSWE
jgi:magnesium-transporting ATPase (P-type)